MKETGDHISVTINRQPFTDFFIGSSYPKPFLHPLRTTTGKIVTRRFPMEAVPGETTDHPHHRGLFLGYGDVNGIDFWGNEQSYRAKKNNIGFINTRKIRDVKGGSKSGKLRVQFEWDGPNGSPMVDEDRTMTFYAEPNTRTIDFDIVLTARQNLVFGDTKEGMFAIRLADSMRESVGGHMANSLSAQGEKAVWGKRADWVDYSGKVDGEDVGITIFDHPSNLRHPPRWHTRAYGLFAVNPIGEAEFTEDKSKNGAYSLAQGKSITLRYRVLIHGHEVGPLNLPDFYQKYIEESKKK